MAGRRILLSLASMAACVDTDVTSGLPCTKDAQCGGSEACEGGYCGGYLPGVSPVGTGQDAGDDGSPEDGGTPATTGTAGDETTSADACFAPEPGCPFCDPLAQDCPAPDGCYPTSDARVECVQLHGTSAPGSVCAYPFDETCAPGLTCVLAEQAGCGADDFFCCTELCDLDGDECPSGTCEPLWPSQPDEIGRLGKCVKEAPP